MTTTFNGTKTWIKRWGSRHTVALRWVDRVVRGVAGVLAAAAAGAAAFQSLVGDTWPFAGWDEQYLRDFSVLMVAYLLLCLVKQPSRPFLVDALLFVMSFGLWMLGFVLFIGGTDGAAFSFTAVILTLGFAILGPILKSDTRWFWQ